MVGVGQSPPFFTFFVIHNNELLIYHCSLVLMEKTKVHGRYASTGQTIQLLSSVGKTFD